jgi:hypothetical protein
VHQEGGQFDGRVYFVETKGYFRQARRKLFREMVKSNPTYNLHVILEADQWVTKGKSRYTDYFRRYMKGVPVLVWKDIYQFDELTLPEDWK